MDYIRPAGGKAEVRDDRGKILRLPFGGEGVPPKPGSSVKPTTNSCCCPKTVPLVPKEDEEGRIPDPRRTNPQKTDKYKPFICIPIQWYSLSRMGGAETSGGLYHKFGGRHPLTDVLKEDVVVYLHPSFTQQILTRPKYWLEWDLKKDTLDMREFKSTDKTIYMFGEEHMGGDSEWNAYHDNDGFYKTLDTYEQYKRSQDFFGGDGILNGFHDNKLDQYLNSLSQQYPNTVKFKREFDKTLLNTYLTRKDIKFKCFQPFRDLRPISDYSFGFGAGTIVRGYSREIDRPDNFYRIWLKDKYPENRIFLAKDIVKPLTSRYQLRFDEGETVDTRLYMETVNHVFYPYLPPESQVTPKVFMKWYKNPENFKYERIH